MAPEYPVMPFGTQLCRRVEEIDHPLFNAIEDDVFGAAGIVERVFDVVYLVIHRPPYAAGGEEPIGKALIHKVAGDRAGENEKYDIGAE